MDNNKSLFITESHIGEHHAPPSFFNADVLSFAFMPIIYTTKPKEEVLNDYRMPNIQKAWLNGKLIQGFNFESFIKQYTYFFIGTDFDREGNGMAVILLNELIKNDVEKKQIVRVPLTEFGFIGISEFLSQEEFEKYLIDKWEERAFIQISKEINGSFGVGRRTALIFNELLHPPKHVENINKNGTSSFTYMFKKSIKEK